MRIIGAFPERAPGRFSRYAPMPPPINMDFYASFLRRKVTSGRKLRRFAGHTGRVLSVAFSPDGKRALSGSADHTLKLWELDSGRQLRTFSGHAGEVRSVAFSPDGKRALSGSADHTLKLWDLD